MLWDVDYNKHTYKLALPCPSGIYLCISKGKQGSPIHTRQRWDGLAPSGGISFYALPSFYEFPKMPYHTRPPFFYNFILKPTPRPVLELKVQIKCNAVNDGCFLIMLDPELCSGYSGGLWRPGFRLSPRFHRGSEPEETTREISYFLWKPY